MFTYFGVPPSYDWLVWGIGLMVGLPLLVVVLGEFAEAIERRGLKRWKQPIDLVRNSCLLLFGAMVLLRWVVGLPATHLAVKIVDTLFWITVINALLVFFNVVIFETGMDDKRSRAPKLLVDLGRIFLVAIWAALVVSHVWQVDLQGLLAALGVGSLVIGLALQDTLSGIFSGVTMISERQFNPGDRVKVGDVEGVVRAISWRAVTVATPTGDMVVIPNGQIVRERLTVVGADRGWQRAPLEVKVAFSHPPEVVREILVQVARQTRGVLAEPPPAVQIVAFEDFAILYRVLVTIEATRQVVGVRSEFLSNLWYAAERHGIIIPGRYADNGMWNEQARLAKPSVESIADRLDDLGTFRRPRQSLLALAGAARTEVYRRGERIIESGKRGLAAHVLLAGSAEAIERVAGEDLVVDVYAPGDLVMFKAFFRGGDAPLDVRAKEDVEAIAVPIAALEAILAKDAALSQEVERLLAMREDASRRGRAKLQPERSNGHADESDRIHLLKEMFRS